MAIKTLINNFFQTIIQCSGHRLKAVLMKEFLQMSRDRLTFAMIIVIPLMQLILFGFAINNNPKHLPTAIISQDQSPFVRAFLAGLQNSSYFDINIAIKNEDQAQEMLDRGETQFVITIPANFTQELLRNKHPQLLVEADATDPGATNSALGALTQMMQNVLDPLLIGKLSYLKIPPPPINVITHAKYNPEAITAYNIVPGLLGVVLTMTLVIITSMGITREREKGTMEHLLATPVKPLEVMIGKIVPYLIVGYIQVALILLAAKFIFDVPIQGSIILLGFAALPFIAANLAIGLTFSSLAKTQLQAAQMSTFFFLPSMLLSGFMFPFRGMPMWAQDIGSILPLTHFLRITRGIILKGNTITQVIPQIWPIIIFMLVAMLIGLTRFRRTLD